MLLGYRLHSSQKDCSYAREFLYLLTETLLHIQPTIFTHKQLFLDDNCFGAINRTRTCGIREHLSWRLDGTDLALLYPHRMTYTTRPSQYIRSRRLLIGYQLPPLFFMLVYYSFKLMEKRIFTGTHLF
uniref:DDE_Tnp_1_7 domain-containing protein n=1 Tax=Heterorhabditis bacteriophora TaxID=37862 RepID=A0A1I7WQ32_HETBA